MSVTLKKTDTVTIIIQSSVKNYKDAWNSITFAIRDNRTGNGTQVTADKLTTDATKVLIALDKFDTLYPNGGTLVSILLNNTAAFGAFLKQYNLEILDQIRDVILHRKGNETLILEGSEMGDDQNGSAELATFIDDLRKSQEEKLGGMLLKTYDSDIFNNWVKTDWIDGAGGITEITALKPDEDGTITMDALNLQQKVYNMLNRIAVSGGTYRDWLETVYTAVRYLDRPETPVFQGGMSQMIEFDEMVATTGNAEGQVLGELAGRGYARQPNTSGRLHFQIEEPGYVMGLVAITPMVDYSQGNDFDLNLFTMDDLHKPALGGIGYQDLMNEQRAWWTATQENQIS